MSNIKLNVPVDKKDAKWVAGGSILADMTNGIINSAVAADKVAKSFDFLGDKMAFDIQKLDNSFILSKMALNTKEILAGYQAATVKYVASIKGEVAKHTNNTKLAMHRITQYNMTKRAAVMTLNKAFTTREPYYYG